MLEVGVDSYITLEEADNLINNYFMSSDTAYQAWETLEDKDKEALLRNSCRDIDSLKFDGRRKVPGQILEFPRVNATIAGIGYRLFIGQFQDNGLYSQGIADGGLSAVKQAQVINAVYAGLYNNLVTEQIGLNIQGLTSKKAGPIQETYNRSNNSDNSDALMGIYTKKVYSILRPWLNDARISY